MSEIQLPKPVDPVDAAQEIIEAVHLREAAKALAKSELDQDKLWCLGCNAHRTHIGIIFLVDPRGVSVIDGTMWTGVRPKGVPYFWGDAQEVVCLQCLVETGERVPLRIAVRPPPHPSMGLCFTIPPAWATRFLHEQSKKALAEFLPKSDPEPKKPDVGPRPTRSAPAPAA
jgi:hypothetical protein